jgi:hypothetical protein
MNNLSHFKLIYREQPSRMERLHARKVAEAEGKPEPSDDEAAN